MPSYTSNSYATSYKSPKNDEYSDSIPPQNYDWTICLLAKTVSKGKINEPLLHSLDGKYTFSDTENSILPSTINHLCLIFLFVIYGDDCIKIAEQSIFKCTISIITWQMIF